MTEQKKITIDEIESLVASLEHEESERRASLKRLIAAHARKLAVSSPGSFKKRATKHGDEAGHSDNSYPPKQVYSDRTGPALLRVYDHDTEDVATSTGFYYSWKRVTTDPGLYVNAKGQIWGADETGTGRLGQFAAHPGDCDVDCTIAWRILRDDEIETASLEQAERELRALAFPAEPAAPSAA